MLLTGGFCATGKMAVSMMKSIGIWICNPTVRSMATGSAAMYPAFLIRLRQRELMHLRRSCGCRDSFKIVGRLMSSFHQ